MITALCVCHLFDIDVIFGGVEWLTDWLRLLLLLQLGDGYEYDMNENDIDAQQLYNEKFEWFKCGSLELAL